jgi:hypothetical protein
MSNSIETTSATTIQSLARTIMQEFDVNQDGQFSYDEFANFLDNFAQTLTGQKPAAATGQKPAAATGSSAASAAATTLFPSAAASTAAAAGTAYRDRMLGFDYSRFDSAKGSLKYDAANIMQGIDPGSPGAMQKAFDQLVALHPGQVSLDEQGNLMLDGTADGYIGVRPLNRSENWDNAPSGYVWQWMAYNDAHPGPNGERS